MKTWIYQGLLVSMTLSFFLSIGPAAHSQNIQVNFGVTFRNARLVPLWIADEEGYFKKQGLDVKQVNISGGTQGAQMMVSGGVDVSYDDPITCIVSTAGGVPVNVIVGGTQSLAYLIVGGPGVKTIADVKGKRVGSSGLGLSASRLALLVGLRRFGIDADKGQATIVAAGQEPERIAGLSTGAIAATVISPEYRTKLEQLGVNMLADLRTLNIPWETSSVITTAKNVQTKRDMLDRVVRAILQAHAYILNPANRTRVIELMTTQLALKSPQDAAAVYEDLVKFYVFKKPYPTRDGFANVIAEVAKQLPKAASIKYEDVVDNSVIEKLDKSGFIDALYK
ncbi:MAG TPA: ABC transporter substrate-binding protein [Terriglobales bacterium]|jgi:NitT/TauT family transport system substrate-binding protein|nr:ABC transporter substrate-binding protein [Terriglobales bacterium]